MKTCRVCGPTENEFRVVNNRGKKFEIKICRKCEAAKQAARRKVHDPDKTPPGRPDFSKIPAADLDFEIDTEAFAVMREGQVVCTMPGFSTRVVIPEPRSEADPIYHPPDRDRPLRRVLFIPDTHAPYHDEKAFQLMLRAARVLQPDIVICLGDFADFYAVSSHSKNPERAADLEYEVGIAKEKLREIEKLNAGTNVYLGGNHEDRLSRYLADRAPALFQTVQIPEVLDLKERWTYVPYKDTYRLGKINLTHDVGTAGRNANRQAMDAYQGSAIIGHTHRMEYSVIGRVDGPPSLGAMFGWLGDFEQIDYMHRVKARRDWVHGFGIGFLEPTGIVHVQPIPIVNGSVCLLGQVVR